MTRINQRSGHEMGEAFGNVESLHKRHRFAHCDAGFGACEQGQAAGPEG